MSTISMFYGILIRMFFYDTDKHNVPHIHAERVGWVEAIVETQQFCANAGFINPAYRLLQPSIQAITALNLRTAIIRF